MSENLENASNVNPGKTLGIAGFVISLVMICFSWMLAAMFALWFGAAGPFVIVLIAVLGLILSIVGLRKSKKAGFKNPLGLTGMIISIVVLAIWLITILFIGTVASAGADALNNIDDQEWRDAMEQLDEALEDANNE